MHELGADLSVLFVTHSDPLGAQLEAGGTEHASLGCPAVALSCATLERWRGRRARSDRTAHRFPPAAIWLRPFAPAGTEAGSSASDTTRRSVTVGRRARSAFDGTSTGSPDTGQRISRSPGQTLLGLASRTSRRNGHLLHIPLGIDLDF